MLFFVHFKVKMVIFKFTKTKQSALAAHVDTLRAVTYLFRRANVTGEYSQGYNPHMELTFSPPLSLGTESLCEYVGVNAPCDQSTLERLNALCPVGMTFVGMSVLSQNVNLASLVTSAEYVVTASGIGNVIGEITAPNYTITFTDKNGEQTKDVSSRIFSAEKIDENTAKVVLATGNDNLRPDRLMKFLCDKYNLGDYTACKTLAFANGQNVDSVLKIVLK